MSTVRFLRFTRSKLEPQEVSAAELSGGMTECTLETSYAGIVRTANLPDRAVALPLACFEPDADIDAIAPSALLFSSTAAMQLNAAKVLCLQGNEFYCQGLLRGGQTSYVVWLRISGASAFQLLNNQRLPSGGCWGCLANMLETDAGPSGLFCMARLEESALAPLPEIVEIVTPGSPFPFTDNADIASAFLPRRPAMSDVARLEQHARILDRSGQREQLSQDLQYAFCARSQVALGQMFATAGELPRAIAHFHRAALLDHPRAHEYELSCHNRQAAPLRNKYPGIFESIRVGERLRTLTALRQAANEFPLAGNAVLSYVLRGIHEPIEGLEAANRSLAIEPYQCDVLANRWYFYLETGDIRSGVDAALQHLESYPSDLGAMSNLSDALSMHGCHKDALVQCERYACFAQNTDLLIRQLFKTHEASEAWEPLAQRFREILAVAPNPSITSLTLIAEAFTEVFAFSEAEPLLERALELEPGSGAVVLALARLLARSGREAAAENLLRTAVGDSNRIDSLSERAMILTLLAEILRRTERVREALEVFESMFPAAPLELTSSVGPLPALEHAETLLQSGEVECCREILQSLSRDFPDDPYVADLARTLDTM